MSEDSDRDNSLRGIVDVVGAVEVDTRTYSPVVEVEEVEVVLVDEDEVVVREEELEDEVEVEVEVDDLEVVVCMAAVTGSIGVETGAGFVVAIAFVESVSLSSAGCEQPASSRTERIENTESRRMLSIR